jgi:SAM-dependent methyltransferase
MNEFLKQNAIKLISKSGYFIKPLTLKKNDRGLYMKLYGGESVDSRRFYNISAGGHFDFGCGIHHPCWTNIDLDRKWKMGKMYDPKKDIAHDILTCTPFPIESNSAELVYSRLSIEHITDQAALYTFKEIKRILKKGGIFRVITINIDLDYRAFKNNDREYFFWFRDFDTVSIEQAFLEHFAASASYLVKEGSPDRFSDEEVKLIFKTEDYEDALNYCTSRCPVELQNKYRSRHINWWNPQKLHQMLSLAGFETIYLSAPEQSISPVLRNEFYFDNMCNKVMLYMEVINS